MSIKERLLCYCKERHTTIGTFCRHAGISSSYFNNVKGDIGKEIQVRIANTYKDLNVEWLRTGEGKMLNPPTIPAATMTPHPTPHILTGNITGNGNAFVAGSNNNVNSPDAEVVAIDQPPIIPVEVMKDPETSLLGWVQSEEADEAQHAFDITGILKKTKFIIKTDDESMSPTLFQNEYVFMRPLPDNVQISNGRCYGIESTTHEAMIRQLYFDGNRTYRAVPTNKQYGEIIFDKDDVRQIYRIIFHGSTQLSLMPDSDGDLALRSEQLVQQGEQISSLINQLDKSGERTDRLIEQNAELIKKIIDR